MGTKLLDGPMGTEIDRRGGDTSLPLWSARALIETPELVKAIHSDYILAHADIITTNTFRTQEYTFTKAKMNDLSNDLTKLAVELARDAIKGTNVKVAGSIAPVEDCYSPHLAPGNQTLERQFEGLVKNLYDTGVDYFLIETMNSIREAKIAHKIAALYGLPIYLSFTCDDNGIILSNDRWRDVTHYFENKVETIGVNCTSLTGSNLAVNEILNLRVENWAVYPNFGVVDDIKGWQHGDIPHSYDEYVLNWLENKPALIGTCCGAIPQNTTNLREKIDSS